MRRQIVRIWWSPCSTQIQNCAYSSSVPGILVSMYQSRHRASGLRESTVRSGSLRTTFFDYSKSPGAAAQAVCGCRRVRKHGNLPGCSLDADCNIEKLCELTGRWSVGGPHVARLFGSIWSGAGVLGLWRRRGVRCTYPCLDSAIILSLFIRSPRHTHSPSPPTWRPRLPHPLSYQSLVRQRMDNHLAPSTPGCTKSSKISPGRSR